MYINKAFTAATIAGMHPSLQRLLDAAFAASKGAVKTQADLARDMVESDQVIGAWKKRGVSESGAIKAEKLYRVSAAFILEGVKVALSGQGEPPVPPRDYSDRRQVSETDWGLLQDVQLVMTDQELADLRARAERTRRIAQEQLKPVAEIARGTGR